MIALSLVIEYYRPTGFFQIPLSQVLAFVIYFECLGMKNLDLTYFTQYPPGKKQETPQHYRRKHGLQSMLLASQLKETKFISKKNNESTENQFEKICCKHHKEIQSLTTLLSYILFYLLGHISSPYYFLIAPKIRNISIYWLYNL